EEMPRGNTLFIGQPPPPWTSADVEKIENPPIKGWINRHAVLQGLAALHEVGISEAFRMKNLPPRTPRLIESERDTGLLLTLNRQSFTDLVMTFPLLTDDGRWNTNWPLRTSFPLFLQKVVYVYGNVSDAASEETMQPGRERAIRPDDVVDEIRVRL